MEFELDMSKRISKKWSLTSEGAVKVCCGGKKKEVVGRVVGSESTKYCLLVLPRVPSFVVVGLGNV